jgi:hypothetical protein
MTAKWSYNAEHRKRPNVHPVATPSGLVLTRDAPPDHPWHHALWFTIKFVNGENFWEENPPYGVLRHVDPSTVHWIRPDRETVAIVERRSIAEADIGAADAYALDWSIELAPAIDVVLDTTPFTTWGGYSGLSLRGRSDWTDTRLLLADGSVHERVLGVASPWCDLSGTVDGGEGGMLFLDGVSNPRHPVPWYGSTRAATYGDDGWSNFLNAAFLWNGPLEVAAGELLTFQLRVVVHDGIWTAARCEAEWDRWTA